MATFSSHNEYFSYLFMSTRAVTIVRGLDKGGRVCFYPVLTAFNLAF